MSKALNFWKSYIIVKERDKMVNIVLKDRIVSDQNFKFEMNGLLTIQLYTIHFQVAKGNFYTRTKRPHALLCWNYMIKAICTKS